MAFAHLLWRVLCPFSGTLGDFMTNGLTLRIFDYTQRRGATGMHDMIGECKVLLNVLRDSGDPKNWDNDHFHLSAGRLMSGVEPSTYLPGCKWERWGPGVPDGAGAKLIECAPLIAALDSKQLNFDISEIEAFGIVTKGPNRIAGGDYALVGDVYFACVGEYRPIEFARAHHVFNEQDLSLGFHEVDRKGAISFEVLWTPDCPPRPPTDPQRPQNPLDGPGVLRLHLESCEGLPKSAAWQQEWTGKDGTKPPTSVFARVHCAGAIDETVRMEYHTSAVEFRQDMLFSGVLEDLINRNLSVEIIAAGHGIDDQDEGELLCSTKIGLENIRYALKGEELMLTRTLLPSEGATVNLGVAWVRTDSKAGEDEWARPLGQLSQRSQLSSRRSSRSSEVDLRSPRDSLISASDYDDPYAVGKATAVNPANARADDAEKMITFEVTLNRSSKTASLGLSIEPYQGHPTIVSVVEGGPAEQDGTLRSGDVIVAIDGKPTGDMAQLMSAVTSARTSALRIAVVRPPLKNLREGVVYFAVNAGESDSAAEGEFDLFEVSILSNRQLIFEQLDAPYTYGQIHLKDALALQIIRHEGVGAMCIRLTLDEDECFMRTIEFYTDNITELREWEHVLHTMMDEEATGGPDSDRMRMMGQWFVMLTAGETRPCKRWVTAEKKRSELILSCFDVEVDEEFTEAAYASLSLRIAQKVKLLERPESDALVQNRDKKGGIYRSARAIARLEVSVPLAFRKQPLGLKLNEEDNGEGVVSLVLAGAEAGSAALPFFETGELNVGDKLIELDGNEVQTVGEYDETVSFLGLNARLVAHTILVERPVEAPMPLHGSAVEVRTKQQHWIMFPCAKNASQVFSDEMAHNLAEEWFDMLETNFLSAQDKKERRNTEVSTDAVLQELDVELYDDDNDWVSYHLLMYNVKGLCFYENADDAAEGKEPAYTIRLETITHAANATGAERYEGVIEVETITDDTERIRVGSMSAACSNLLSALNLYKRGTRGDDEERMASDFQAEQRAAILEAAAGASESQSEAQSEVGLLASTGILKGGKASAMASRFE